MRGFLLFLVGCSNPTPFWAVDNVFLVPTSEGVTGSIEWNLYEENWQKRFNSKHYVCSLVVDVEAAPSATDCDACVVAFDLASSVSDTDCDPSILENPLYLSTQRLGIGALDDAGPYPDASSVAWADYGGGWEEYGWAYPETVALGQSAASFTWNDTEAFSFTPIAVWQLDQTTSGVAPLSRSVRTPE